MKRKAVFMTGCLLIAGMGFSKVAAAQDTIKVGVLHSLSGTMAISETTLKDTILMMIDAQNKKGGLLGKKLRGGCGRSSVQLAALCGEGRAVTGKGQSRRGVRMLDLRFPEIRAACFRKGRRLAFLSRAV